MVSKELASHVKSTRHEAGRVAEALLIVAFVWGTLMPAGAAAGQLSAEQPHLDTRAQAGDKPDPPFELTFGAERRRDRFTYRFWNPSNITDVTVDHFFQQRYTADNTWFVARARGRAPRGAVWAAGAGVTPQVSTFGEDLDTFFNPGNNIIVSGTSGVVYMRSARASGWFEPARRRGRLRLGYAYRRDRSIFRTPERKTVTTTNPPSVVESVTFDHETTVSEVHEMSLGWSARRELPEGWRLSAGGDVSPLVLARLSTALPEKYPGQTIRRATAGVGLAGRIAFRRGGRWPIEAAVDVGRVWPYRRTDRFTRESLGVRIAFGVS